MNLGKMINKIFNNIYNAIALFAWSMFIVLMFSCGFIKSSNRESNTTKYLASFQLDEGKVIYEDGGYRYGPSIIVDQDGTIHAWFASPGGIYGKDKVHYLEDAVPLPIPIRGNTVVAQYFSSEEDFYGVVVRCPNWNSTTTSISFSIYRWQGSYQSSIVAKPIMSKRFHNYIDNQNIIVDNHDKFPAGNYLWVLDAPQGNAGIWAREGTIDGVTAYLDGKIFNYTYESFLMLKASNAVTYWDQVAYKKSTDGGVSWSPEKLVLKPTEGTRDQYSICDPGLVKIGRYYYLAYTSTEDIRMIFNHTYVARSLSPEGPWQKWNGKSWATDPQPIIEFNGDKDAWGAGEPSMVVRNDSLFVYYTWRDKGKHEVRVAVADARSENWPNSLHYMGVALDQLNITNADHADVKYRPDLKKFQLLHTASRFEKDAYLMLWESSDGIEFQKVADIKGQGEPYLHNCGWSADNLGHQDPRKVQYIGYAYGKEWGNWKTKWHPIVYDQIR